MGILRHGTSIVLLLALMPAAIAGDNWPAYRGPTGDGQAGARALPIQWSETKNIRWKTPIHDKGWSSPVIWGNQVWLTTARADGKKLFAVSIDCASGKIVRDITVFEVANPAFCHTFNSYASPTPVVEAGRIYVHFGTYGTACLDTATGQKIWERRDLLCDHYRGPASSPILHQDLLFLIFDGYDVQYVAALDKNTGKTVWKKDRGIAYKIPDSDYKKAYATPAVIDAGGKPQLICPSAEATIAYDPFTGQEIWRVHHGGMNASCRPFLGHGLVFVTTGHNTQLLAVNPAGAGNITKNNVRWKFNKGVPTRSSPLLVGDLIYMASDAGVGCCVEARTGERVWQERLGSQYSASPIHAGGHIYFFDQEDSGHVLEPGRKLKVLSVNKLADGCMASPAVSAGCLFVRTKTHLYCIEEKK